MARLARLVVPGLAHLVVQRGHSGQSVFADTNDQQAYLNAVREAAASEAVQVHAWALLPTEVRLLLTPQAEPALGRFMQAVGRRYVSAYNRRHGRAGTLWDGRFRAAVVQPGLLCLLALRWVDGASAADAHTSTSTSTSTSATQRLGGPRDAWLTDPPEYWQLGNTPFEREAAYGQLLTLGLPPAEVAALCNAALASKALGTAAFLKGLGAAVQQRQTARPRGRPRRTPG
jgi:putative transposase